jgi:hypothetical protein
VISSSSFNQPGLPTFKGGMEPAGLRDGGMPFLGDLERPLLAGTLRERFGGGGAASGAESGGERLGRTCVSGAGAGAGGEGEKSGFGTRSGCLTQ